MTPRILVVDDEEDILDVLEDFFTEKGYAVSCASNAAQAMGLLAQAPFDLLLSDINMPGKKGFELLSDARALYPSLKTALITAYDVRDYIKLAQEHDVGNIITKTTPFNFDEIDVLVRNILTGDVFGLQRYISGPISSFRLSNSLQIEPLIENITASMPTQRRRRKFRQALGEIIINAVYYGAKNERGDRKQDWDFEVQLTPDEEILVTWGADEKKTGVAVRDQKGRLKKADVLYWLERNTTKGENGLTKGLFDEHGKGLYISRETLDRFIINIKRNAATEAVMLLYHEGLYEGHRPLWIQEI